MPQSLIFYHLHMYHRIFDHQAKSLCLIHSFGYNSKNLKTFCHLPIRKFLCLKFNFKKILQCIYFHQQSKKYQNYVSTHSQTCLHTLQYRAMSQFQIHAINHLSKTQYTFRHQKNKKYQFHKLYPISINQYNNPR